MKHSITEWRFSKSPNYNLNKDKVYPYSEVPYIGQYNLVKIPISLNDLIEHVDYWGEGRIITESGNSGFTDCYNINHPFQLVSNGADRDSKIPNRIPVTNYTDCNTASYIKDNSVKFVTVMGAPINKSCSKDIARMINADAGKVVIYGFDSNQADVKNFEENLNSRGLLYCHGYQLTEEYSLNVLTLFDSYRVYLNLSDIKEALYKNVSESSYENAINISQILYGSKNGGVIADTVTKLLNNGITNIVEFGMKLWNEEGKEIVNNHFPDPFKLIFNEDAVKIVNKKIFSPLKLDANIGWKNNRLALGDTKVGATDKFNWKFISVWDNNAASFKIKNMEYNEFLKLDDTTNEFGDRKGLGSREANGTQFLWNLEPVKVIDEIIFFISNKQYNQGLKLGASVNENGDRLLWGHNGTVYGNPDEFGWFITSPN